jgi:hypothetical protein
MSESKSLTAMSKTKTVNTNQRVSNLFIFGSTLAGVVVGVVASLAMVGPMIHSDVASATNGSRTLSARTASDTFACSVPNSAVTGGGLGGGGSVLGASTGTTPVGGGTGGDNGGTNTVFVHKLVSGVFAKTTATISGNGAESTNTVTTINKNKTVINNDNDVTLTNNNSQNATSGDANTDHNVSGSGTAATTGTAENTSSTDMKVNITN